MNIIPEILLFYLTRYLFQKSTFILDATIKDKDIYSKNTNFYVDKTIGRIQFLITVEYADSYVRKYITLIDSLTIIMTTYNIITKLCWILNYLFTKSYLYCSIFEPISNCYRRSFSSFNGNFDKKINFVNNNNKNNNTIGFSTKNCEISQIKKDTEDISVLKLNNINNNINLNNISLNNKTSLNSSFNFQMKYAENQNSKNDEIKKILIDIQEKKISNKINFSDKFFFLFAKMFNINTKKQLYLQRVEKLILNDLSIDFLFQKFKKKEKYIDNNLSDCDNNKINDVDKYYYPSNLKK